MTASPIYRSSRCRRGKGRLLGQTSELWNMHSSYEVHFGRQTPGGTVFEKEVDTLIRSDGIPFEMNSRDFDHDGQIDMMFAIIDPGIFKVISILIRGLLTESVHVAGSPSLPHGRRLVSRRTRRYSQDQDTLPRRFREESDALPVVAVGGCERRWTFRPAGASNGPKELHVFNGVQGPDLFARKPQKVAVTMPHEEYTWLVDFNKDRVQDLLMHHPSTTEPHRVVMLIAR